MPKRSKRPPGIWSRSKWRPRPKQPLKARIAIAAINERAGPTKTQAVIAMCQRANGATINEIMEKLGISQVAATSLIADIRRKGIRVNRWGARRAWRI